MCKSIRADQQPEEVKRAAAKVYKKATEIGNQLQAWLAHLRDSDFKGDRDYRKMDREAGALKRKRVRVPGKSRCDKCGA